MKKWFIVFYLMGRVTVTEVYICHGQGSTYDCDMISEPEYEEPIAPPLFDDYSFSEDQSDELF